MCVPLPPIFHVECQMKNMHPATCVLWLLLILSLIFNCMMAYQIKELKQQVAPIIIRPNIRLYDKRRGENLITMRHNHESTRII